jgi:hypothetical protein
MGGIAKRRSSASALVLTLVVQVLALVRPAATASTLSAHIRINDLQRVQQPLDLYSEASSSPEADAEPGVIVSNATNTGAATAAGYGEVSVKVPGGRRPQLLVYLVNRGEEGKGGKEIVAVQVE